MLFCFCELVHDSRWADEDRLVNLVTHFVICPRLLHPRPSCVLPNRIEPLALLVYLASLGTVNNIFVVASLWHNIEGIRCSQLVRGDSDRVATVMHAVGVESARRRKLIAHLVNFL